MNTILTRPPLKPASEPRSQPVSNDQFIVQLQGIADARHVLTSPSATRRFRKGIRFGEGPALAVVRPGSLVEMWRVLDRRGAEYPAEHNVGHLYNAKPSLVNHYRSLDPSNSFNPGIGHTRKLMCWQ